MMILNAEFNGNSVLRTRSGIHVLKLTVCITRTKVSSMESKNTEKGMVQYVYAFMVHDTVLNQVVLSSG